MATADRSTGSTWRTGAARSPGPGRAGGGSRRRSRGSTRRSSPPGPCRPVPPPAPSAASVPPPCPGSVPGRRRAVRRVRQASASGLAACGLRPCPGRRLDRAVRRACRAFRCLRASWPWPACRRRPGGLRAAAALAALAVPAPPAAARRFRAAAVARAVPAGCRCAPVPRRRCPRRSVTAPAPLRAGRCVPAASRRSMTGLLLASARSRPLRAALGHLARPAALSTLPMELDGVDARSAGPPVDSSRSSIVRSYASTAAASARRSRRLARLDDPRVRTWASATCAATRACGRGQGERLDGQPRLVQRAAGARRGEHRRPDQRPRRSPPRTRRRAAGRPSR